VVLTTVAAETNYHYLDTVKITGKLKIPVEFPDFNYKQYLLKDGIYSVMDYPKIEIVSTKHAYNIFTYSYEKILFFKEKLRDSIYTIFSPPQSLLLEGILLGNNKTMTTDLRNQLNASGLRYLTAISGVHVIIISAILMTIFLALGFWRGQAFYFSVAFIWLYIVLTGFTASGIRAATMGSIFLLAQKLGRQNTSSRTITLAATLMLMQNPLLLLYDIGFQLSFMASMGIIYGKPIIEYFIKLFTKDHFYVLVEMLSVTFAAQLFIIPLMVFNFGNVSLVAPITSLLVLPIMPPLLLFGFLACTAGIFSSLLGWIISLPAFALLLYFTKILDVFSQPWALATLQNVSWAWLVVYYAALAILVWWLQKFTKPKFLGY
ncbi:MAG: ComEC/Rec2 family competence protein, partial [Candidatus Paceibacterales bacterium]